MSAITVTTNAIDPARPAMRQGDSYQLFWILPAVRMRPSLIGGVVFEGDAPVVVRLPTGVLRTALRCREPARA